MGVKCFVCGKKLEKKEAIFRKGKFFGSKDCLKKFDKMASIKKGEEKNVCEFC
jgi:YHS domain-containing protein